MVLNYTNNKSSIQYKIQKVLNKNNENIGNTFRHGQIVGEIIDGIGRKILIKYDT